MEKKYKMTQKEIAIIDYISKKEGLAEQLVNTGSLTKKRMTGKALKSLIYVNKVSNLNSNINDDAEFLVDFMQHVNDDKSEVKFILIHNELFDYYLFAKQDNKIKETYFYGQYVYLGKKQIEKVI